MTPLEIATAVLATRRLQRLVVEDTLTEPIRDNVSERAQQAGRGTPVDMLDDLINCPSCASVWSAGGILLASRAGRVGRFLVGVLALSEAALTVRTLTERIDR